METDRLMPDESDRPMSVDRVLRKDNKGLSPERSDGRGSPDGRGEALS